MRSRRGSVVGAANSGLSACLGGTQHPDLGPDGGRLVPQPRGLRFLGQFGEALQRGRDARLVADAPVAERRGRSAARRGPVASANAIRPAR